MIHRFMITRRGCDDADANVIGVRDESRPQLQRESLAKSWISTFVTGCEDARVAAAFVAALTARGSCAFFGRRFGRADLVRDPLQYFAPVGGLVIDTEVQIGRAAESNQMPDHARAIVAVDQVYVRGRTRKGRATALHGFDKARAAGTVDSAQAYHGRWKRAACNNAFSLQQRCSGEVRLFRGSIFIDPFAIGLGIHAGTGNKNEPL